jgi:hypothetical protein
MRFEVLTAAKMKTMVICFVMLFSLVDRYQHLGGTLATIFRATPHSRRPYSYLKIYKYILFNLCN